MSLKGQKQTLERLRRKGLTLEEIGKRYDVTKERVRQVVGSVVPDRWVRQCFDPVEATIHDPWGLKRLWCRGCGEVLEYNAGHGLCVACYNRKKWREDPERRRKRRVLADRWKERNPEKYREIQRRSQRRWARGHCPVCDRMYAQVREHFKRTHPPEEYQDLLEQVLEEKRREREGWREEP